MLMSDKRASINKLIMQFNNVNNTFGMVEESTLKRLAPYVFVEMHLVLLKNAYKRFSADIEDVMSR